MEKLTLYDWRRSWKGLHNSTFSGFSYIILLIIDETHFLAMVWMLRQFREFFISGYHFCNTHFSLFCFCFQGTSCGTCWRCCFWCSHLKRIWTWEICSRSCWCLSLSSQSNSASTSWSNQVQNILDLANADSGCCAVSVVLLLWIEMDFHFLWLIWNLDFYGRRL